MREQPVDGAIEIAAIRPDDARDIGDDRGRNLESLMHQLGGDYACLEILIRSASSSPPISMQSPPANRDWTRSSRLSRSPGGRSAAITICRRESIKAFSV